MFLAGIALRWFAGGLAVALVSLPAVWVSLHGYQKERLLTFLGPVPGPVGAGWNITQSKIALGSGGVFGKGFLEGYAVPSAFHCPRGTPTSIFTMLAEELGMGGRRCC